MSEESERPVRVRASHRVQSVCEAVRGSSQCLKGVRGSSQGLWESEGPVRV